MSKVSLVSKTPFVYLSSNIYHSPKTDKDYYNVTLFDTESGDSCTVNCDASVYADVQKLKMLEAITAILSLDLQYNRLTLLGFNK